MQQLPFPLSILPVCAVLAACRVPAALAEDALKNEPGGPLEATASRGVTARDPSTIVREGDTFWCFFTGRGTPSLPT